MPGFADVHAKSIGKSATRAQKRAVGLARAGNHERALTQLEKLLERYPAYYPLQRDYIMVASWAKDCERVRAQYEKLTPKQQLYPKVVVPGARCIREQNRVRAAIALLEKAKSKYPRSASVRAELREARAELKSQRLTFEAGAQTESSELGSRELRLESIVYGEVNDNLHAYSRLLMVYADDPLFATGDVNRIFGGLEYIFGKTSVVGELSTDLVRPDETGIAGIIRHRPNDRWLLEAGYYTFSEDIPLRAKALNISSDQLHLGLDYHTDDYVWEWTAAANAYSFSDSNKRREWYTEVGYGFDLQEDHEQRAVLELSQSNNTLAPTVYYNPLSASTLIAGYKYYWVIDSKYKRRADEVFVWAGNYDQQGFGSNPIYGVRYQQNYEFDDISSMYWYVSWSSKVYDGNRESGINLGIRYKRALD